MKIRALVHITGEGLVLGPGDETDKFSDDLALRLIAKRAAVMVEAIPAIEMAVASNLKTETRKGKRR